MAYQTEEDEWLGTLIEFPPVLHARASLSFDASPVSLQKALVSSLRSLHDTKMSVEISTADRDGYSKGEIRYRVGVGNREGFDILDSREEQRLLNRIETIGMFDTLDLAVNLSYRIRDDRIHRIHEDYYAMRLVFKPGLLEVLVHHFRGVRRVGSIELVTTILENLNLELARVGLPELNLEEVKLT